MPEENPITTLRVQRKIKPQIEDVLPYFLDGDMLKTALDFTACLRENKMTPRWAGILNAWKAICKGKPLYYIRIINDDWKNVTPYNKYTWVVTPYLLHIHEYDESVIDESLRNLIWDHIGFYCRSCRQCAPGGDLTVFGREIKSVCVNMPLTWVWDPDEAAISGIKRLLEHEKQARNGEK